jgi:hypothetical protein
MSQLTQEEIDSLFKEIDLPIENKNIKNKKQKIKHTLDIFYNKKENKHPEYIFDKKRKDNDIIYICDQCGIKCKKASLFRHTGTKQFIFYCEKCNGTWLAFGEKNHI